MKKLYKVIKKNQSFHGGKFDWSKHLPKSNGKPGKWTPHIPAIQECETGYHVTPYPNMWWENNCRVYLVETKGLQKKSEPGVIDKYVCAAVRLLREVTEEFKIDGNCNTGNRNTGNRNTGDYNTGNYNTGNCNTGNCNTGNRNTGYRNTGDYNTGNYNTGNCNTGNRNIGNRNIGNCNTGNRNTGNYNTGYCNTGNCNTGNCNTGYRNTGYRNTGNRNTGNYNTGNCNTGAFNTGEPKYYELFNAPVEASIYKSISWPSWFHFRLKTDDYKASWAEAFQDAEPEEVKAATKLPNFDYAVFEEITGITEQMIKNKIK